MVEQGCSGSWTESVGPRSERRTPRGPQELFDLFLAIKCFMISTGTWRTCLPFSSASRYHNSRIYLDGRQLRKLSTGKERMFASALPRSWTTSATIDHFHFSFHQISSFHSHTAIATLRLNMLSKIWGEACCLIQSHLRWTYSRKIYLWSSNIMVLS